MTCVRPCAPSPFVLRRADDRAWTRGLARLRAPQEPVPARSRAGISSKRGATPHLVVYNGGLGPRGRSRLVIERVYLDNIRTFVNFEWRPGSLAILLGPNGAGKTALLETLGGIQTFLLGEASSV